VPKSSSQVKSSQVKSSQVKSSQVKSRALSVVSLIGLTIGSVLSGGLFHKAQAAGAFLYWPTTSNYGVSCGYGCYSGHVGIDINVSPDYTTPIMAAADGVVVETRNDQPYGSSRNTSFPNGNYVKLKHQVGNEVFYTAYLHMTNNIQVSTGTTIRAGQTLGYGANSGLTCGSDPGGYSQQCVNLGLPSGSFRHLHFQVSTAQSCSSSACAKNPYDQGWWKKDSAGRIISAKDVATVPAVSMLVNIQTGRALDAGGANGTQIYLYPQPNNNPYQRWKLESLSDGTYMVINVQTGRALDGGGSNGTQAYIHPQPMPWNSWQKWKLQPANGGYMLINVASGRVLDAGGANGTATYMYQTPNGNPYQVWRLPG
jgi:murein DD-endopeptidase MepM/ murein hydrolase activator NlpD